jgi:hypothetical protein
MLNAGSKQFMELNPTYLYLPVWSAVYFKQIFLPCKNVYFTSRYHGVEIVFFMTEKPKNYSQLASTYYLQILYDLLYS